MRKMISERHQGMIDSYQVFGLVQGSMSMVAGKLKFDPGEHIGRGNRSHEYLLTVFCYVSLYKHVHVFSLCPRTCLAVASLCTVVYA